MHLEGFKWNACNPIDSFFLQADMNLEAGVKVGKVLDQGLRVMAYHGELDFICNWEGGLAWVNGVGWSGGGRFRRGGVRDVGYGLMKGEGRLRFLKFRGAGHMVPMDKPREALVMFEEFMKWTLEEEEG